MYLKYEVDSKYDGKTAQFILKNELGLSTRICNKIKLNQGLKRNTLFCSNKDMVETGDILEVELNFPDELIENIENPYGIEVVFEDEWYVIVNKPALLPTHPRFYRDDGLSTILSEYKLYPANRLDMGTSGLVIMAKNPYAQDMISKTPIQKIYLAMAHNFLPEKSGVIAAPIGREENTIIFRKVSKEGKNALTHYRVLAEWEKNKVSLIAFLLETGRTHQIRVHCRYMGCPLIGDQFYGWEQTYRYTKEIRENGKLGYYLKTDHRDYHDPSLARDFEALKLNRELQRQFLHAYILDFNHPITGEALHLKAKLAEDLESFLIKVQECEEENIHYERIEELLQIKIEPSVRKN